MALVPAMPVVRRRVRMLPLLLPPECRLAGNEDAGSSPRRVSSRSPARATRTMVPRLGVTGRSHGQCWAEGRRPEWSWVVCRDTAFAPCPVAGVSARRGDPHGSDAASASMPSSADVASTRRPRRRGTSPGRTRYAPAGRRPVAGAGVDPPPGPATGRSWRSAVPRRHGRRCAERRRRRTSAAASVIASRRSARTRSVVVRSMPLRRSSSRIARSPRGRARSRELTQSRANCSSSSMPSSPRRSMAPSTSVGW